jgi:hypothetical protein
MNAKSLPGHVRSHLAVLSMKDEEFRKALIADPMNTVRTNFGLPEGTTLRVVEVDAATSCIVIPRRPPDWPSYLSVSDALSRLKMVFGPLSGAVPTVAEGVLGLIAKAMVDEKFAARLISNPESTMREEGIALPNGVKVMVVQENVSESVIIIPKQANVAITDDDLDATAILLQDSLTQTRFAWGSWPFSCSNPPTWCPSCQK